MRIVAGAGRSDIEDSVWRGRECRGDREEKADGVEGLGEVVPPAQRSSPRLTVGRVVAGEPQSAAGTRIEPPVSVPMAASAEPS